MKRQTLPSFLPSRKLLNSAVPYTRTRAAGVSYGGWLLKNNLLSDFRVHTITHARTRAHTHTRTRGKAKVIRLQYARLIKNVRRITF